MGPVICRRLSHQATAANVERSMISQVASVNQNINRIVVFKIPTISEDIWKRIGSAPWWEEVHRAARNPWSGNLKRGRCRSRRRHHGPGKETRSYWPWSSSETVRVQRMPVGWRAQNLKRQGPGWVFCDSVCADVWRLKGLKTLKVEVFSGISNLQLSLWILDRDLWGPRPPTHRTCPACLCVFMFGN